MKRFFTLDIVSCARCPYSRVDDNKTRNVCCKTGETIYWLYSEEEDKACGIDGQDMAFIPDWCPLWKQQGCQSK